MRQKPILVLVLAAGIAVTAVWAGLGGAGGSTPAPKAPRAGAAKADSTRPQTPKVPRAMVMKAQEVLVQAGSLDGKPTGSMNPATRAAIRVYQKKHGLKVTGTLTAQTLQKMGLEADSTAKR